MGTVGYLLDTHTFLWAVQEKDSRLSNNARVAIANDSLPIFISSASAYEIMNKYRLGKLPDYAYVAENYFEVLRKFGADELSVNTHHTHFAGKFVWTHRDPFDRLLAAQAVIDNLIFITNDPVFQELSWMAVLW